MFAARHCIRTLGLAALLAVVAAGCDPPPPDVGHDLSGTVTYEGKEVQSGEIYFTAKADEHKKIPRESFVIENGKYSTAYTRRTAPVGPTNIVMNFVVDEQLYSYEGTTDLPPSPGKKDFALTRSDAKKVPKLATPGGGGPAAGGGEGKGKGTGKGKGGRGKGKGGTPPPALDEKKDEKKTDEKSGEEKKADDTKTDEKKIDDKKTDDKKTDGGQI